MTAVVERTTPVSGNNVASGAGPHQLESPWTFWYDKKPPKHTGTGAAPDFEENLKNLGIVTTAEEFFQYYAHLQRPSHLVKDTNVHLFRGDVKPMWERYPYGGSWILRVKKDGGLDRLWEKLCFALIGEAFEDPNVVGGGVSLRSKEDVLSLWIGHDSQTARFTIGEKLRVVLGLGLATRLEFKDNYSSLKDNHGFYRTAQYQFVEAEVEEQQTTGIQRRLSTGSLKQVEREPNKRKSSVSEGTPKAETPKADTPAGAEGNAAVASS